MISPIGSDQAWVLAGVSWALVEPCLCTWLLFFNQFLPGPMAACTVHLFVDHSALQLLVLMLFTLKIEK